MPKFEMKVDFGEMESFKLTIVPNRQKPLVLCLSKNFLTVYLKTVIFHQWSLLIISDENDGTVY